MYIATEEHLKQQWPPEYPNDPLLDTLVYVYMFSSPDITLDRALLCKIISNLRSKRYIVMLLEETHLISHGYGFIYPGAILQADRLSNKQASNFLRR